MRDWAFDSNISGKYFVLEDEEGNPVYEVRNPPPPPVFITIEAV